MTRHVERTTRLGRVRGLGKGSVDTYLGLPYASPPRRFSRAQPVEAWARTYDATRHPNQAMQKAGPGSWASRVPGEVSEDCLYLNIFVPRGAGDGPLPVIVWIHGGGFVEGSANAFDGQALAAATSAVVVTINYRLGLFGLLDPAEGRDPEYASNLFLADQITALQWVQDNIADYQGDPARVLICGQSAGATSVICLAASAHAGRLFNTAAAMSPAFVTSRRDILAEVAAVLGISRAAAATWLRSADPQAVAELGAGITPQPVVDGRMITEDPHQALAGRDAARVPLVTGFAPHEGDFLNAIWTDAGLPDEVIGIIARASASVTAGNAEDASAYLDRLSSVTDAADPLVLSDLVWTDMFRSSSLLAAEAVSLSGGMAWHYLLNVPASIGGRTVRSTHCVDLPLTFLRLGRDEPASLVVSDDALNRALADRWVAMLAHLANFGAPGESLGTWSPYNTQSRPTLVIEPPGSRVVHDLDKEWRTGVWTRSTPISQQ